MRLRRMLLAVVVTGVLSAFAFAGPALAGQTAPDATTTATTPTGKVTVKFHVKRFLLRHAKPMARTRATFVYHPADHSGKQVARKDVYFKVTSPATARKVCHILHLRLDHLNLDLLGLHVVLKKPVVLNVTATRRGGILGRLLCSLADGSGLTRHTAMRKLNRQLMKTPISMPFKVKAAVYASSTTDATAECQILNLILGPLDVRLLGLRVHLSKVHLVITAVPGELLGDLLCPIIESPPTTG